MTQRVGHLSYDPDDLRDFCQRWEIKDISLFGSAFRPDFTTDSDLDFLVSFTPTAHWDALDLFTMQDELEAWFGRAVDLIKQSWLKNPIRRERILETRKVLFESGQKCPGLLGIGPRSQRHSTGRGSLGFPQEPSSAAGRRATALDRE